MFHKYWSHPIKLNRLEVAICLLLVAAVVVVFGDSVYHGFLNFDDDVYVYENAHVLQGWNGSGVAWAFTHSCCSLWAPLTFLSLMTDSQLYGTRPSGYHFTNICLHALATVLLFMVLRRMTGCRWRSAFVAAVFAVHPLRVESVAWIAERKDVLSGVFFMLTLWAYWSYTQRRFSWWRYGLVIVVFALGLMSKPMLVTLPCVLLLLDYWPLQRLFAPRPAAALEPAATAGGARLVRGFQRLPTPLLRFVEKLPLFALAVGVGCITLAVQNEALSTEAMPWWYRLCNAAMCYVTYIQQWFWPVHLAVLYPRAPHELAMGRVAAALAFLAATTLAAWLLRRRCPYVLVGWLWYLGMLAPVLGLVQFGIQANADRFTYLPQIGLALVLTWGAADLCRHWRVVRQVALPLVGAAVLVALMGCTWWQTTYWRTTETLWKHTIECTRDNYVAHNNRGLAMAKCGDFAAAVEQYQCALAINPRSASAYDNLGIALAALAMQQAAPTAAAERQKYFDEAVTALRKAIDVEPDYAAAYNSLGSVYAMQGKYTEAMASYRQALKIDPQCKAALDNLTTALIDTQQDDEALKCCQEALATDPGDERAHYSLADILVRRGQVDEALPHLEWSVQKNPGRAAAHRLLAGILTDKGRFREALTQYRAVLNQEPKDVALRNAFAQTLVRDGWFGGAVAQYSRVLRFDPQNAEALQALAWLYATCPKPALRNGAKAEKLVARAEELAGKKDARLLDTLAAAQAETGKYAEATATARDALALATTHNNASLAEDLRKRLALYEAGKPFLDTPAAAVAQ